MAHEICPHCGAAKHQLMRCSCCGYCHRSGGPGTLPSPASVQPPGSIRSLASPMPDNRSDSVDSIKDALRNAYREKGEELSPKKKASVASSKKRGPGSITKEEISRFKRGMQTSKGRSTAQDRHVTSSPRRSPNGQIVIDSPMIQPPRPKPQPPPNSSSGDYCLTVATGATLAFGTDQQNKSGLLNTDFLQEHVSQCSGVRRDDEREIVIGLDFGTSSVKVVIGDYALSQSFAVPFVSGSGLTRYSRLM